jgi:hypothetical protein
VKSYIAAERKRAAAAQARRNAAENPLAELQRSIGNRAFAALLQRDDAKPNPLDPKLYGTFGAWLDVLPGSAVDENAVNVTGEVAKSLPDLASLVQDLRADCADVTILLRHYYLQQHGDTATIPGWDAKAKKTVTYAIGKGVSRKQLRSAVSDLGTIHFQETGRKLSIVDYYLDDKKKPLKNLKKIVAKLQPGDLLVWKKIAGIRGNFSGHVQTVKGITGVSEWTGDEARIVWGVDVVQGTMENGQARGEIQKKRLTFRLLTGRVDGDGDITYTPSNEEEFFGAGRWK